MNNNELARFSDIELPAGIEAVRFDLRRKDVALSAKLVAAAVQGDWPLAASLLEQKADPRICRHTDGMSCESALYLALKAEQFSLAAALYDAGDRLDDLRVEENAMFPAEALDFLSRAAAHGEDYFCEDGKPLSECVRCGLWAQTQVELETAPQAELDLAVEMIAIHLRKWNADVYLEILTDLKARGANIARVRDEFQVHLAAFRRYPAAMRPSEEVLDRMADMVRQA